MASNEMYEKVGFEHDRNRVSGKVTLVDQVVDDLHKRSDFGRANSCEKVQQQTRRHDSTPKRNREALRFAKTSSSVPSSLAECDCKIMLRTVSQFKIVAKQSRRIF